MVSEENKQHLRKLFPEYNEVMLEQLFVSIDNEAEAEAYRRIVANQLKVMKDKTKKLNEELKQQLALEQGFILTEIVKRAEYGSEAGLLIEVMKAKTVLDEAMGDWPNYYKARDRAQQNKPGVQIYRKDVLEEFLFMQQEWVKKHFGINVLDKPLNANLSSSKQEPTK